jgi:hypothetical protein
MPTLVISREDGSNENLQLDGEIVTIGRHPDSVVRLYAGSASNQHAALMMKEDGRYYLQDLGSSNGTRVNGVLIEEAMLSDGDQIAFGDEPAAYFDIDVNPTAAATPAPAAPAFYSNQTLAAQAEEDLPLATPVANQYTMPRAAPPRARSYQHYDSEGTGCGAIFIISLLFIGSFLLGLTLRHYNQHGSFLLNDLTARFFGGAGKVNIQLEPKQGHP